jgi:thiopurine S-methyltransferase
MEADFWHDRWRLNQIGFHQTDFNRHLVAHWGELGTRTGARVFVPLCGKSRDLIWLAKRGHSVVGCEISKIAVGSFFDEAGLAPRRTMDGPVERWRAGAIEILLGDFFGLSRETIGGFDAVYDRAALVALPATMRPRYVKGLCDLATPGTAMLLVTVEYPQHEREGPPFSVAEREVRELFGGAAEVELLESLPDAREDSPRLRERKLTRPTEHVFRLRLVGGA